LLLSYFLFFVRATLRQVALNRGASRRVVFRSVLSGGNQWELRLARINKFNILSADTKFCFCHFYGIAYTEKMICCCFLFAFFCFGFLHKQIFTQALTHTHAHTNTVRSRRNTRLHRQPTDFHISKRARRLVATDRDCPNQKTMTENPMFVSNMLRACC